MSNEYTVASGEFTKKIMGISDILLNALTKYASENDCSDKDLYLGLIMLQKRFKSIMGEERTKALDGCILDLPSASSGDLN